MTRTPMTTAETDGSPDEPALLVTRKRFNEILPGRLYQRGQILTWTRAEKTQILAERRIKGIVNFWPKQDVDLADVGLDWYLFVPAERSSMMVEPRVMRIAEFVSAQIRAGVPVLALCEAGKTRSVFFSILVVSLACDISYAGALHHVIACVPAHSLKRFMLDYLSALDT